MNTKKCIILLLSATGYLHGYKKICEDSRKLMALRPKYNFAYTYNLSTGQFYAGLPRSCGVTLTQTEKQSVIKELQPHVNKSLNKKFIATNRLSDVTKNVLKDFFEYKNAKTVKNVIDTLTKTKQ